MFFPPAPNNNDLEKLYPPKTLKDAIGSAGCKLLLILILGKLSTYNSDIESNRMVNRIKDGHVYLMNY